MEAEANRPVVATVAVVVVVVVAEPAVVDPGLAVAEGPVGDRAFAVDGQRRCRDGGGRGGRVLDG